MIDPRASEHRQLPASTKSPQGAVGDALVIDPLTLRRCSSSTEYRSDWQVLNARARWYNADAEFACGRLVYVHIPTGEASIIFRPARQGERAVSLDRLDNSRTMILAGMYEENLDLLIFDELVHRLREGLVRFAATFDVLDPEDIVQHCLIKLWTDGFRGTKPLGREWTPVGSAFRFVKNECLNEAERTRVRVEALRMAEKGYFASEVASHSLAPADGRNPSAAELDAPDRDRIGNQLLDRLPSEDRQILLWCFGEERSYGDIAGSLGITEDAVRKRYKKAWDRLRSITLEQTGRDPGPRRKPYPDR